MGQFRAADFGDMWRTKELELMCPNNPIGTVDLLFASSHGAIASGSVPFVHGLQPRVVLMQNGTRKGGAVDPMKTILASPGLETRRALEISGLDRHFTVHETVSDALKAEI